MALRRLGPEHEIAIKWLSMPKKGGKTIAQIAEECSVSERTVYNWMKDPLFEREWKAEMVRSNRDRMPELIQSLSDIAIRDGNAAMAKLALQINGMLVDKYEIEAKDSGKDIDYEALENEIESFGDAIESGDTETE